jgi:hypothetical protein
MENLDEVKYSDLNNQKKTQSVKDMQKAAHSQGYTMSDPETVKGQGDHFRVKLTHRKTGKEVKPKDGSPNLGGAPEKGGGLDNTLRNRTAKAIKDHAKEIGRQDKRPAAKAKRKEEAAKNKEAKKRDRDPFTRKKKSLKEFLEDVRTVTEG